MTTISMDVSVDVDLADIHNSDLLAELNRRKIAVGDKIADIEKTKEQLSRISSNCRKAGLVADAATLDEILEGLT